MRTMALNTRQLLAYNHTCNLWRPTQTIDPSTGVPSDILFVKAYSRVKVHYEYTDNVSDAIEGAGRVKRPTIFTDDSIHMDAAQECDEGWIAQNTSILPDGTNSPIIGECHMILGGPNVHPSSGNRRANKRKLMAQVIEHPPAEII